MACKPTSCARNKTRLDELDTWAKDKQVPEYIYKGTTDGQPRWGYFLNEIVNGAQERNPRPKPMKS